MHSQITRDKDLSPSVIALDAYQEASKMRETTHTGIKSLERKSSGEFFESTHTAGMARKTVMMDSVRSKTS